jgi:hypothetical protein
MGVGCYRHDPIPIGLLEIAKFCIKLIKMFKSCRLFYPRYLDLRVPLTGTSFSKALAFIGGVTNVSLPFTLRLVATVGFDKALSWKESPEDGKSALF